MFKKYGDIVSSLFFLTLAVAYFIASLGVEIKDPYGGASLVPKLCAIVVALASLKILYDGIKQYHKSAGKAPSRKRRDADEEGEDQPSDYVRVTLTFASLILYALLFQVIGFMAATVLYMISQMLLLAPKNKKPYITAIVVSLVFSGAIYLVFTKLFWIMLPTGTIW
jgi:putative tricarboxylic transport membrane protein